MENSFDKKFTDLRKRAAELLNRKDPAGSSKPRVSAKHKLGEDITSLLEELNIYQVELEMQHDELKEANLQLKKEKKRYQNLYMDAPSPYFTLNETANVLELNHEAAKMLGRPVHQCIYTSLFPFIHSDFKDDFAAGIKKVFEFQKYRFDEVVFINHEGKLLYTQVNAVSFFDEEHKKKLCRLMVTDLTEVQFYKDELRLHKELAASEKRMSSLFKKNGVPMLVINAEHQVIEDANDAAHQFYGYPSSQLIGKHLSDLNVLSENEIDEEVENVKKSGKKYFLFKHRLSTGEIRDVEVYSTALEYGNTVKLFSIIHDVTDRLGAQEKVKSVNKELSNAVSNLNAVNMEVKRERAQFLSILDSIPEFIYVSDFDTGEIFFANKTLNERFGRNITGEICYRTIQNQAEKCDFCTNSFIMDTEDPYFWEYYNPVLKRYFYVMDRKIQWEGGKSVRFELAVDITDRKIAENELRKLSIAVERSPSAIVITDKAGTIEYVNEAFTQVTGFSQDEARGKNPRILKAKHFPDSYYKNLWETLLRKEVWRGELFNRKKDGTTFWEYASIAPILNQSGHVTHFVAVKEDITQRKESQRRLSDRLRYEKSLTRFSGTLFTNQTNVLESAMRNILEATECSRFYLFENFYDDDNRLSMRQIHEVCAEGVSPQIDNEKLSHVVYERDGFMRWENILSSNQMIKGNVNDFPHDEKEMLKSQDVRSVLVIPVWTFRKWYGFIGFDDISERNWKKEDVELLRTVAEIIGLYLETKENQKTILERNRELKKSNATKNKFFNIIAHDLKSPFTGILGLAELLKDSQNDLSPEDMGNYLSMIYESSRMAYRLLENLLEWSRAQTGRITYQPGPLNLKYIITEVSGRLKASLNKKHISLNVSDDVADIRVYADENMTDTVLRNLLSNAVKFTPRGGVIEVRTRLLGNFAEISVCDNGIGIPPEISNNLFDISFKTSRPGTDDETGTGIGLPLCKEFIEKHGGTVDVRGRDSGGTCFSFTLPALEKDSERQNT